MSDIIKLASKVINNNYGYNIYRNNFRTKKQRKLYELEKMVKENK